MKVDVQVEATLFDGSRYYDDENDSSVEAKVMEMAAKKLAEMVSESLVENMTDVVTASIKEKMDDLFLSIIDEVVQPTNNWGESSGKPTTLREIIQSEASKYLGEAVNNRGEVARYRDDNKMPRIQYIAKQATTDVISEIMSEEVTQLKKIANAELGELKSALREYIKK